MNRLSDHQPEHSRWRSCLRRKYSIQVLAIAIGVGVLAVWGVMFRQCRFRITMEGGTPEESYICMTPVVETGSSQWVQTWPSYEWYFGICSNWRLREDSLNDPPALLDGSMTFVARRVLSANRYGFVVRRCEASFDSLDVRIHWISPEDLEAAVRTGSLTIPRFESMEPFDLRSIR